MLVRWNSKKDKQEFFLGDKCNLSSEFNKKHLHNDRAWMDYYELADFFIRHNEELERFIDKDLEDYIEENIINNNFIIGVSRLGEACLTQ